jgi:hypothetical protein
MAFNVRMFAFRGIEQIPNVLPKQYSSDSVYQLVYPYEFAQTLSAGAVAVSSSPNTLADKVVLVRIEVPEGQVIRFEINPPNRPGGVVTADVNSPRLTGNNEYYFRPGWTVSVIDASTVAP